MCIYICIYIYIMYVLFAAVDALLALWSLRLGLLSPWP